MDGWCPFGIGVVRESKDSGVVQSGVVVSGMVRSDLSPESPVPPRQGMVPVAS